MLLSNADSCQGEKYCTQPDNAIPALSSILVSLLPPNGVSASLHKDKLDQPREY